MTRLQIKADVRYLLFSEIYYKLEEPKAKRKAFAILESTIQCLAKKGFEGVTLEMIAREAAVTRPLIKYYFNDLDDLIISAIKFIRLFFQKFVVDQMMRERDEVRMLERYAKACFQWTDIYKSHSQVWLAFLHRCTRSKSERALNTIAVQVGEQRLSELLAQGKEKGLFRHENSAQTAKIIQTLITGAMVTVNAEDFDDPAAFADLICAQCLSLASK
jgi:AcrR family transcriptional regulator